MKNILLCTDGSEYSQVCCQYAVWLAKRTGAKVEALYLTNIRKFEIPLAADISGSLGIQPYGNVIFHLQEIENKKAEVIEETTRKIFSENSIELIKFHHRTGLLVDCLDSFEPNFDLIMLGKRGENVDFAKEHLGSSMERVVRASQKPCLITSRSFHEIKKILIAYDGGKSSKKAVDYILNSTDFDDFELHLVTVTEQQDGDTATSELKGIEEVLRKGGKNPICNILNGEVEKVLADYIESENINMLLMGAYGHSLIRRLLIGSTTSAMMQSCHLPIMCFR